jgi:glucose/arabinose dehydrogenase
MNLFSRFSLAALATLMTAIVCRAQTNSAANAPNNPYYLLVERVASGLTRPLFGAVAPGDSSRMFIVEQRDSSTAAAGANGTIRILNLTAPGGGEGTIDATPFLSVPNLATGPEQGLLGLAFHPDYATNGRFFVNYTERTASGSNANAMSHVTEYQRQTTTVANPASANSIMNYSQPFTNHNGGWLGFGPNDGELYIATGDGGRFDDPDARAQNTNDLLGKMLRINVNADDFLADPDRDYAIPVTNPFAGATPGADEIWAYGLRNPWRSSFDRANGDFYIADVGQGLWEEVNVQPANAAGGINYGWRSREGQYDNPNVADPAIAGAVNPILNYAHPENVTTGDDSGRSITGGYVYRGPIAELQGMYFYADYQLSRIWSAEWNGTTPTDATGNLFNPSSLFEWTDRLLFTNGNFPISGGISSFVEGDDGSLYVIDYGLGIPGQGEVFRIFAAVPEPTSLALVGAAAATMLLRRRRNCV